MSLVSAKINSALSSNDRLARVKQVINKQIGSDVQNVEQIISHNLGGGKGLRALISHIVGQWGGLELWRCDYIAAVVEMIHVASLLHDDVVDDATTRRHKPSTNVVFGNHAAVLGGDFLYSRASQMLCKAANLATLSEFADATNQLAEGELLEQQIVGKLTTREDYMEMIGRKTGALFSAAAVGAAVAAEASALVEPLRSFGYNFGLAFQIMDDCLDYVGRPGKTGKTQGLDFAEGKVTLPLYCALQSGTPEQVTELQAVFAKRDNSSSFAKVKKIIEQVGAVDKAREIAAAKIEFAETALAKLPADEFNDQLSQLTTTMLTRNS